MLFDLKDVFFLILLVLYSEVFLNFFLSISEGVKWELLWLNNYYKLNKFLEV